MSIQEYKCESCNLESHVTYEEHAGVYEVFTDIFDDHRKRSPECKADRYNIKITRGEIQTV